MRFCLHIDVNSQNHLSSYTPQNTEPLEILPLTLKTTKLNTFIDHSPSKNHIDKRQARSNHINLQDISSQNLISRNLSIGTKMLSNCLILKVTLEIIVN